MSDLISEDVYEVLSYKNAVARRNTQGRYRPGSCSCSARRAFRLAWLVSKDIHNEKAVLIFVPPFLVGENSPKALLFKLRFHRNSI